MEILEYKFEKREEYEEAIKELIKRGDVDAYDKLVEEYIKFCDRTAAN